MSIRRRTLLKQGTLLPFTALLASCQSSPTGSSDTRNARVVIIGGGFGGVTAARTLKAVAPDLDVVLIEPRRSYVACPFSNLVVAGLRDIKAQTFGYTAVEAMGVRILHDRALEVDPVARRVTLDSRAELSYDRLIMAPGIELNYDALPGYSRDAANSLPHAWDAGPQTVLLRDQLRALPEGGTVAMAIPDNPYRCPPGPYERASLIAWYLKQHKPRAKLLLLDAKDRFSKQPLFMAAWKTLYGDRVEWLGRSDGAAVIEVDAANRTLITDFDQHQADVVNVIPPQRAAAVARRADLTDRTGWCPIDAATFESSRHRAAHVIGDAAIANAMPKSAFAANAQGRLVALQILRSLNDLPPIDTKLMNTCYSLVSPDYGISVAGVYAADGPLWASQPGSGGASPMDAPDGQRKAEANYARAWFRHITDQVFG